MHGCDMVLDGPFEHDNPERERKLLGSANQRIVLLTERYKDAIGWFDSSGIKMIEVNVGNMILANGDPF